MSVSPGPSTRRRDDESEALEGASARRALAVCAGALAESALLEDDAGPETDLGSSRSQVEASTANEAVNGRSERRWIGIER